MEIRKLAPTDDDAYRRLWKYAITECPMYFRTAPEDPATTGIPTRFAPDSFTLGAYCDSRLVGIVSVARDTFAKTRHKALLSRMFVHPDSAGHGVGKALLAHATALAADVAGLRYLYLTVLASNPRAIHLYSSQQFSEYAREPGSVLVNGRYIDELQMARQLGRT